MASDFRDGGTFFLDEVTFEARFKNIFDHGADGSLSIDISAIHEVEPAA